MPAGIILRSWDGAGFVLLAAGTVATLSAVTHRTDSGGSARGRSYRAANLRQTGDQGQAHGNDNGKMARKLEHATYYTIQTGLRKRIQFPRQ